VRELTPGLWWWEAVHPDWTEEDAATEGWGPEVSSYALDDGERLLLIDPTMPPGPVDALAGSRDVVIVLTCPWHARDAPVLVERYGALLFSPRWDNPADEVHGAQLFAAGDKLPIGVEAFPGMEANDLVLWVERRGALIAGDTLIDRGRGLEFPADWANKGLPPAEVLASLQPLLELPAVHVLPTHGPPTDRAALERALA
jgi:glyoxylase-like metal-dependent hydrolase (beta-lactamase superfamily II)